MSVIGLSVVRTVWLKCMCSRVVGLKDMLLWCSLVANAVSGFLLRESGQSLRLILVNSMVLQSLG